MARIDFYILPDTTLEARLAFACKLAETIWRKGYRLHLHCEDKALAEQAAAALRNVRQD
ncbi:DNA polymerase III subunit chi, partial [Halomonas sp.]|uniref:DNA polymerase III subunit chi n=1 Tax=Halomonas sp. TaxID=1486246 RepID=UPI003F94FDE8